MADYFVTHSRKDGADADRRIDALMIGGQIYPIDTVINWIESGVHRFFVDVWGRTVKIVVRIHPTSNRRYLTTEADGFPPNNLLALPNC